MVHRGEDTRKQGAVQENIFTVRKSGGLPPKTFYFNRTGVEKKGMEMTTGSTGEVEAGALAERVAGLAARVDELSRRLELLESRAFAEVADVSAPASPAAAAEEETVSAAAVPEEEGFWSWLGRNAVLPRVAAACFMLVVALILRTVTDSGGVSPALGTVLGLSYVFMLFVCGWRFYATGRVLAPVFTGCGLLLAFSIIAESRSHFSILPTWLGSSLLVAATAAAVWIALSYRSRPLLWFAVLGGMTVSLVLDFPDMVFPAASLVLAVGFFGSMKATEAGFDRGLRWIVLAAVMFLFFLWGFKLNFAISRAAVDPVMFPLAPALFSGWFLPALLLFCLLFWGVFSVRFMRGGPLGAFVHVLPLAGAVLMTLEVRVVVVNLWRHPAAMGALAMLCGAAMILLALMRHRREPANVNGFASLAAAAALLSVASVSWLSGGPATAQIFWPLIFVFLLILSRHLGSGNTRFVAVFTSFVVMASGAISGVYAGRLGAEPVHWLATVSGSLAGLGAYLWCRRVPPPDNGFFSHIDRRDHAALSFLVSGLVCLFFLASLVLGKIVAAAGSGAVCFDCGRTVIINIGAAMLIVWGAIIRKDPGVALVGIVVALIGGAKVFFVDFFNGSGVPLVLSVTSFGALAALCSVVLGNWQKMYHGQAGTA